jgi:hypothetical protein
MLVALIGCLISAFIADADRWESRRAIDRMFLYLRPFSDEKAFNFETVESFGPNSIDQVHFFDTSLARILKPFGKTKAIGRTPGSGMEPVTVADEEWFREFSELADRATLIFVVPSASKGCVAEMRWIIRRGFLAKCVFVMPPVWRTDMRAQWKAASEVWKDSLGLTLPESTHVALFRVDDAGQLSEYVGVLEYRRSDRDLRRAVLNVLPHDKLGLPPTGYERSAFVEGRCCCPVSVGRPIYSVSASALIAPMAVASLVLGIIAVDRDYFRTGFAGIAVGILLLARASLALLQPLRIEFGPDVTIFRLSKDLVADWRDLLGLKVSNGRLRVTVVDHGDCDFVVDDNDIETLEAVLVKVGRCELLEKVSA